jgi:hypothetical protein
LLLCDDSREFIGNVFQHIAALAELSGKDVSGPLTLVTAPAPAWTGIMAQI